MKLIIDIPEEAKQAFDCAESNDLKVSYYDHGGVIGNAIKNGTPLPKNHGRLIDADYLRDVILLHNFHGNNKNIVPYADRRGYRLRQREVDEAIINAPVVIEANKESEE